MAKKKKVSEEKKASKQAKKEAKADKSALKRLNKESKKQHLAQSNNDNSDTEIDEIDAVLSSLALEKKEASSSSAAAAAVSRENTTSVLERLAGFPPPRANCSMTLVPTTGDMIMFGGEYYDGVENVVYDDLFLWTPPKNPHQSSPKTDHATSDNNGTTEGDPSTPRQPPKEEIGEWKQIFPPHSNTSPPPRCSHQAVLHNNSLYILGGELATAANFHHYRDFWRLDLKSWTWEEIVPRGNRVTSTPSARSGHKCWVWRHYLILFGGFYEAARETKWYNDLWVYDFQSNLWSCTEYSRLATIPGERSAFSIGCVGDEAFLFGGYSKLKDPVRKSEQKVHTDCWVLNMKGIATGKVPSWNRLTKKGEYPSKRSGMGCAVYKQRLLVFGGVQDDEGEGHKLDSVFYDDLFALDMDTKRWYNMRLKAAKKKQRRRKKDLANDILPDDDQEDDDQEEEDQDLELQDGEAQSNGWDLNMLKSNMFAFIDANGNIIYEKIEDDEDEQEEKEEEKEEEGYLAEAEQIRTDIDSKKEQHHTPIPSTEIEIEESNITVAPMEVTPPPPNTILPPASSRTAPLPRINPAMVVKSNTLYLYGGLLEVGDREVTLDDLWCIDLQKRDKWVCIWEGTMHCQVWKGVDQDEEESYISSGFGGEMDDDDSDEEQEEEEEKEEEKDNEDDIKPIKKKKKKSKKSGIREEIEHLKAQLNLDDSQRTPQMGESKAEFYARTSDYWNQQAAQVVAATLDAKEDTPQCPSPLTSKEMKRAGFAMARDRFEELQPVLERLNELEEGQKNAEQEGSSGRERKKDKKEKKEKKKRSGK